MLSAPSPIIRRLLPAANCICLAWVSKHMEISQMKPSLHFEPQPRQGLCELFCFFKTTTKGWRAPLKSHYCMASSFFSPPPTCVCVCVHASGCLEERRSRPFEDAQENVSLASRYPRPEREKKAHGEETLVSLIVFNAWKLPRAACVCIQKWLNQFLFLLRCAAETARRLIICWNGWKKYVGHQQLLKGGLRRIADTSCFPCKPRALTLRQCFFIMQRHISYVCHEG